MIILVVFFYQNIYVMLQNVLCYPDILQLIVDKIKKYYYKY